MLIINIFINYNNFKGFINIKKLNNYQKYWLIKFINFNFKILYRLGLKNPINLLLY